MVKIANTSLYHFANVCLCRLSVDLLSWAIHCCYRDWTWLPQFLSVFFSTDRFGDVIVKIANSSLLIFLPFFC